MIIFFYLILALKVVFVSFDNVVVNILLPLVLLGSGLVLFFDSRFIKFLRFERFVLYFVIVDVLLFVSALIAYFYGFDILLSVEYYIKILTFESLFLLGAYTASVNDKKSNIFFKLIVFLAFVHILSGVLSPLLGLGTEVDGVVRYAGLAGKINILANFALFFSVFFFVLYKESSNHKYLILFILSFLCILSTGTIKNVLVLVFIISFLWVKQSKYKSFSMVALVLIFLPAAFYLVVNSSIGERVDDFLEYGVNFNVEAGEKVGNSMNWRILHWKFLLIDWYENYFFFGVGIGQYSEVEGLKTTSGVTFDPHNDYIKFLIEYGIFLFLGFITFLVKVGKTLYRYSVNCVYSKALLFSYISALFAMLAGQLIFSLVFFYFFWPMFGFLVYKNDWRLSSIPR